MTSTQPFSVEAFLEFCRGKPARERYRYSDTCNCASAQFVRQAGYPGKWFEFETSVYAEGRTIDYVLSEERTFGALVTRLERALAEQVRG